jgi:hypothetical protein
MWKKRFRVWLRRWSWLVRLPVRRRMEVVWYEIMRLRRPV